MLHKGIFQWYYPVFLSTFFQDRLEIKSKWLYNLYQAAPVAQWIERLTTNQKVGGSSPSWRGPYFPRLKGEQYAG